MIIYKIEYESNMGVVTTIYKERQPSSSSQRGYIIINMSDLTRNPES